MEWLVAGSKIDEENGHLCLNILPSVIKSNLQLLRTEDARTRDLLLQVTDVKLISLIFESEVRIL
jgi:hypothetical protein